MIAGFFVVLEPEEVYRPRHAERTDFYKLLDRHFDRYVYAYEERFEPRSGHAPALWTLPDLPRPVDGAEAAPPTVRLDGSCGADHSSLESARSVFHSDHRAYDYPTLPRRRGKLPRLSHHLEVTPAP